MRKDFLKLSIPPELSYLPLIQTVVLAMARRIGFMDDQLYEIEVAVEEAVSNVVVHAFSQQEGETFEVICERVPLGMRITIREKGIPFDPRQIPDYRPAGDLETTSAAGMGVFLMKRFMDEVSFHNLGMGGKETRLVKYLPTKDVQAYLSPREREETTAAAEANAPPPGARPRERIRYTVRRMEPAEAVEIARCAYKSHGYTFFDDHIYYPERIVELNATDEMISAVAVTEDNVFMGHSALVYPGPDSRIAEFTFVFVNQEYRGQGCMKDIAEYLFTCPKKNPMDGIYVYSVTNHEFTQRGMAQFGIRDCGLLLASSPETWVFKGIEAQDQRISVALSFRYLVDPPSLTLYPPARHRKAISRLYKNIGASRHRFAAPVTDGCPPPPGKGEIETEVFTTENCAEIRVIAHGDDVLDEVRKIVRELCLKNVSAIQLFLDLRDPHTFFSVSEYEKMGFFLAGILPMSRVGEALILQYLNNVRIDYDKLALYTEEARWIRDYVREMDPHDNLR
ncbi:MAG: ATP-binding protein [Pseudomonadota bacterium]|nr:ATP-binding protein [Pseudomonadota bacterium]